MEKVAFFTQFEDSLNESFGECVDCNVHDGWDLAQRIISFQKGYHKGQINLAEHLQIINKNDWYKLNEMIDEVLSDVKIQSMTEQVLYE